MIEMHYMSGITHHLYADGMAHSPNLKAEEDISMKKPLPSILRSAMALPWRQGAAGACAEQRQHVAYGQQNFNIKSMRIAADRYAADHEGFSAKDIIGHLTTAANAGDYSTLPRYRLMRILSKILYQMLSRARTSE